MTEVAGILARHSLSSAPVVDEEGVCVGIVSAADFLRRDAAIPNGGVAPHHHRPAWTPEDVAATYMSSGVQTVAPTTPLLQAANIQCAQHVHHLPVVDHAGKPIGMVSTMDIISALLKALTEQANSA
jgi:CBS-domain-containing membrane protein